MIDPITNKIFHQLFTSQNCQKLSKYFIENGDNFNNILNIFFPKLNWTHGDESNINKPVSNT